MTPDPLDFRLGGRFGNVVIALINTLARAEAEGRDVILGDLMEFSPDVCELLPSFLLFSTKPGHVCLLDHVRYSVLRQEDNHEVGAEAFYTPGRALSGHEKRRLMLRYIAPLLRATTGIPGPTCPDSELVIHVRSGDIFDNYHHRYLQPPLAYYTYVIEQGKYERITLVTEADQRNPVIKPLIQAYGSRLRIQTGSLRDDVATLLTASHLCVGVSTFAYVLSLASTALRHLFCFQNHAMQYDNCPYAVSVLGAQGFPRDNTSDPDIYLRPWKITEIRSPPEIVCELWEDMWAVPATDTDLVS
jgi:hypothetical protein